MRHVVVEGPDGAGKTVLASRIAEEHGLLYHHEGPPPQFDAFGHYCRLLDEAFDVTVFDRFHVGEAIYGPLLRGGSQISTTQLKYLNREVDLIVCLPPWEVTLANSRGRRELIEDESVRRIAYDCWTLLVAEFQLPTFDYTTMALDLSILGRKFR